MPHSSMTEVSIRKDAFYINDKPTYEGRMWNGFTIEGLLMNSRMVQGTFDDNNPDTVSQFAYPDTMKWDPDRNTREFVENMTLWKQHGLNSFTLNLQGGNPRGYGKHIWTNSAFLADGQLDKVRMARLRLILDEANRLGMIVILGYFYFGQDWVLKDETAIINACDQATDWLLENNYRNVIIEINNECNVKYTHPILKPERVHELILRVKDRSRQAGYCLLCGTSYGGGFIPLPNVVSVSDFILIHGNGVSIPEKIADMVRTVRNGSAYKGQPILFNEDDHFDFDQPQNNMVAAISQYAGWGFFDYRMKDEGFEDGYQSVPVDWGINSLRKIGFFKKLSEITSGVCDRTSD